MLTWTPSLGQLAPPLATHLLIAIVLLRHSFSVWAAVIGGMLLISVLREARRLWPRIGGAIHIALPCSSLPCGEGPEDPGISHVIRVVWSLPHWLTVELASPAGREVVDIFGSEMAADELARLRRWAQLDRRRRRWTRRDKMLRFSRQRAARRPADP